MGTVQSMCTPLSGGLGACENGIKLSHCPGFVVPGNA